MEVNLNKSFMLFNNLGPDLKDQISQIMTFPSNPLDQGVKYLGSNLKPNDYNFESMLWLYKKLRQGFLVGAKDGCLVEEH